MAPNRKERETPTEQTSQGECLSSIRKRISFSYILSILPILLLDLSSVLVSFCTLICRSRLCAVAFSNHLFSPVSPTTWLSTRS